MIKECFSFPYNEIIYYVEYVQKFDNYNVLTRYTGVSEQEQCIVEYGLTHLPHKHSYDSSNPVSATIDMSSMDTTSMINMTPSGANCALEHLI